MDGRLAHRHRQRHAARALTYKDRVGELAAHQLSTGSAIGLFAGYFELLAHRRPLPSTRAALEVGAAWLALTIAFEFGFGHSPQRRWRDRLVARGRRLQPHPRPIGGLLTGPSPVDRARAGSKHHLMTDASGLPLAITLTGGNRNDITQLLPLLDAVGPLAGKVGRPRKRPNRVIADRGYDHDKYRREVWRRGGSATPTSTSPSCTWPAPSSAGGDWSHCEAASPGAGTGGMVVPEVSFPGSVSRARVSLLLDRQRSIHPALVMAGQRADHRVFPRRKL